METMKKIILQHVWEDYISVLINWKEFDLGLNLFEQLYVAKLVEIDEEEFDIIELENLF